MYPAPFNNQVVPQMPMGQMPSGRKKLSLWGIVVTITAIVLAALLLIATQGLDNVLRLFGVGASGIYEASISSTRDWLGGDGANSAVIGVPETMSGTSVFGQFSSVPSDPYSTSKDSGFVAPIFSSADLAQEIYQEHIYISSPLDLGVDAPYLNAIEVVDYSSAGAGINYFYKYATTKEGLAGATFRPVDPTLANSLDNQVKVRTAVVDQAINRFAQIKIEFVNSTFSNRPAVYAVTLQYKPEAPVDNSVNQDNTTTITRNITLQYDASGVPAAVDIDIISSDISNSMVYSAQGINLAQNPQGYNFQANLAEGVYALTISAPQLQTRIIPFPVDNDNDIIINAGSFAVSTGLPVNDLNGDGVVNGIDFLILQQQNQ